MRDNAPRRHQKMRKTEGQGGKDEGGGEEEGPPAVPQIGSLPLQQNEGDKAEGGGGGGRLGLLF